VLSPPRWRALLYAEWCSGLEPALALAAPIRDRCCVFHHWDSCVHRLHAGSNVQHPLEAGGPGRWRGALLA